MFALKVMNLIGDVKGKVAVMVDDMIDTAGMSISTPYFEICKEIFLYSALLYCIWWLLAGLKRSI